MTVVFGLLPFKCTKQPEMNRNSPNGLCDVFDLMTLFTIDSHKITIDCRRREPERLVFDVQRLSGQH